MSGSSRPLPPRDIAPPGRPLVVQSDGTLLLDTTGEWAGAARDALSSFAHLERSPEYVHTYRITPLSLWNAAAAGVEVAWIEETLDRLARYPVPELVRKEIREQVRRFGRVRLRPAGGALELQVGDPALRLEFERSERLAPFWLEVRPQGFLIRPHDRGALKQALVKEGYPAEDLCGYVEGAALAFELRDRTASGLSFSPRPYQEEAVSAFHGGGGPRGGAGVVVLPCGAGKTVVGIAAMERVRASTLILTSNTVAVHQWRDELLDKTDLHAGLIGEYTGAEKEVRPVTITTYQMLTHRAAKGGEFEHLDLLRRSEWGLLVYDEVHLLPAPVFRVTAEIQARRRLGLTATLVREDGREGDVFALIGPKCYDLSWKVLEAAGYIAEATCWEIRLDLDDELRMRYALAKEREKFRLAAENPSKAALVAELIDTNPDEQILVIGQYLEQLETLARRLGVPLITGKTPVAERERLYAAFRRGEERVLVVSKVANFAIDLPDASMALEVSGTYGSRQEEAQRLGRILRPKNRPARFFTLVSRDTREQEFAARRQRFLVEQGYRYRILEARPEARGRALERA
jgi:DNA excision repair protein ERCC-3